MRSTLSSTWLVMVLSLASCAQDRDFGARLDGYESRSRLAAALARQCATELRALAGRDPLATIRALDELHAPFVSPTWIIPETSWSEIDRHERELEAARNVILHAEDDGPAALERVVGAVARLQHLQAHLCRARDVATTLAAMTPSTPREAAIASERARRP